MKTRRTSCLATLALSVALVDLAPSDAAFADTIQVQVPTHLTAGGQSYDPSPAGLRAYLSSIQTTQPALFAALDPKVARLESRQRTAWLLLGAGAGVSIAAMVYAFAGRKSCPEPSVTDPNFEAATRAWSACNDDNQTHLMTFSLLGGGALLAGGIAALVTAPSRADVFDVVNDHNRSSPSPLQWEVGYDAHHVAYASARLAF